LSVMRVFVLRLCTKSQVRRPFRLEDYDTLPVSTLVDLVTFTFDLTLKLVCNIVCGVGNIPTNFGVFMEFLSRLIGQHLSDALCDLATLTFDLGGQGVCRRCESSCSVRVPSLKFIGLPVLKILRIYCVSINWPGDLDFWPFDL